MANSILSLIFPLSGEDCLYYSEKTNVNIQFRTKKMFSKARRNAARLGLVVTSDPRVKGHQRRLLFQAAVTAAQSGKSVLIITPQPWDELPLDIKIEAGVHKMPKVTLEHLRSFKFVYPRNLNELFLYISALGGVHILKEMPDLILLENVEDFSGPSTLDEMEDLLEDKEREKVSQRLSTLFSFLDNLSNDVSDHKRFNVLVSSAKKESFGLIEKNYFWLDEIWETATRVTANGEEDMELVLLGQDQTVELKLKFSFLKSTTQYFFKSLITESEKRHTKEHANGDVKEPDNRDAEEEEMCDDYDLPSSPVL